MGLAFLLDTGKNVCFALGQGVVCALLWSRIWVVRSEDNISSGERKIFVVGPPNGCRAQFKSSLEAGLTRRYYFKIWAEMKGDSGKRSGTSWV